MTGIRMGRRGIGPEGSRIGRWVRGRPRPGWGRRRGGGAQTGEPVSAAEAYEMGLVHAVVPRDQLEETARAWAQRIAGRDQNATRAAKRAVIDGIDMPLEDGLALERRLALALAAGANDGGTT